jgi:hypothetical protein
VAPPNDLTLLEFGSVRSHLYIETTVATHSVAPPGATCSGKQTRAKEREAPDGATVSLVWSSSIDRRPLRGHPPTGVGGIRSRILKGPVFDHTHSTQEIRRGPAPFISCAVLCWLLPFFTRYLGTTEANSSVSDGASRDDSISSLGGSLPGPRLALRVAVALREGRPRRMSGRPTRLYRS